MYSALLPVIYLTFVSLGLPDAAIGAAWPTMYSQVGAGVAWQGILSTIICLGTIASSLGCVRLVRRLGTHRVVSLSVGLTAVALVGFSLSREFWQLCLIAIPYGLGAGAIDAALNTYVSIHYAARHMSWLHCMWGVGATLGPAIMSACLTAGGWSQGFLVIGGIQLVITAVVTVTRRLWGAGAGAGSEGDVAADEVVPEVRPASELVRIPGVMPTLVCFFCYCALESTCGQWAASYCTFSRGISAAEAAGWASLMYLGVTAGRAASGLLTLRFDDAQMIRLGQAVTAVGLALVIAPLGRTGLLVGLVAIGCGCAPIYPSIIHATPSRFGEGNALALTGIQMAGAYVGSLLMPPLMGLVGQSVGFGPYPLVLAALLAVMVVAGERVNRVCR